MVSGKIYEAPGAGGPGPPGPVGEDELLGAAEVAAYLGVNQGTVYRWCREERLPCVKVGKYWRLRRSELEGLLVRRERPATLASKLDSFLEIPDNVLGIARNRELLHRLDAAFLKVGEARGALLVKFHGGETGSEEELRADLERAGLEAGVLEREGRLRFVADAGNPGGRLEALGRLAAEEKSAGRSVWAAYDWEQRVGHEAALDQQQALTRLVEPRRLVIKTSLLEELTDDWSAALWRRAQTVHPGTIWLTEDGITLSRTTPFPGA